MEPDDRLERGRDAAERGDYAFALEEYLWFHHHALESRRGLAGVRLSYALKDWKELAAVYPPAMEALVSTRDSKAALLLGGKGGFAEFHDVTALNQYLEAERESYELLRQLRDTQPAVAERCATLAWHIALQFGDFAMAREYLGDPGDLIEGWLMRLNADPSVLAGVAFPFAEFISWGCRAIARDVIDIERVLTAVGERHTVDQLRGEVLAGISAPAVRDEFEKALAGLNERYT
jgi:hypothetical protein